MDAGSIGSSSSSDQSSIWSEDDIFNDHSKSNATTPGTLFGDDPQVTKRTYFPQNTPASATTPCQAWVMGGTRSRCVSVSTGGDTAIECNSQLAHESRSRTSSMSLLPTTTTATTRPFWRRSVKPAYSDAMTIDSNGFSHVEPTFGDDSLSGLRLGEKISVFQDWWSRNMSRIKETSGLGSRTSGKKSSKLDSMTDATHSETGDSGPEWLNRLNAPQEILTDAEITEYRNMSIL